MPNLFRKSPSARQSDLPQACCCFEFEYRREYFFGLQNETLSVVSVGVNNPDRSALVIKRRHAAPAPPGFAEIVSDDFPVTFHGCRHSAVV